jgi:hypothetical protein
VLVPLFGSQRRVLEPHRVSRLQEEVVHRLDAEQGRVPVEGVFRDVLELERFLLSEPQKRVVQADPLLVMGADVQVDPRKRDANPDAVRAVEQDPGHERRAGGVSVLVLPQVSQGVRADGLLRVIPGPLDAAPQAEEGVDRVGVVEVVRRDQRRIERAGQLGIEDVVQVILRAEQVGERSPEAQELVADIVRQVLPLRVLVTGRRLERVRGDVAEAAAHADAERADGVRPRGVLGVVVVALGVPPGLRGRGVEELRVPEQPQPYDARRVAVDFVLRGCPVRLLLRFAILDVDLLRVGVLLDRPVVANAVGVLRLLLGGRARFGLGDQAGAGEAPAAVSAVDQFQEVDRAVAVAGQPVPERLVAPGPHDPGVPTLDRFGGQFELVGPGPVGRAGLVHVLEVVEVRRGEVLLRGVPPAVGRRVVFVAIFSPGLVRRHAGAAAAAGEGDEKNKRTSHREFGSHDVSLALRRR